MSDTLMRMRAVVVVGIVALLCGAADAGPKKKRHGTFAAYIDPAAPNDRPRPKPAKLRRVSIVWLIDRTQSPFAERIWRAASAVLDLRDAVDADDQIGLVAYDATTVEKVLVPVWGDELWTVWRTLHQMEQQARTASNAISEPQPGDLVSALEWTREYLADAYGRRLIVLVADNAELDGRLEMALHALREDRIALIVLGQRAAQETLETIAETAGGTLIRHGEDRDLPSPLARAVRALRSDTTSPNNNAAGASVRWTTGSARSASPPPP